MRTQNKKIELPLVEPLFSAYHNQGPSTAILVQNPSIRNYYLNNATILTCNRKFLSGFTSPELEISGTSWAYNPYFVKKWYDMQFLKGYTQIVIHNLLDSGYYVCFSGVDDYYVEGKSWYHEKHFKHDGCICGYNRENKTFCVYAYDKNWIYQKFWTPQKAFDRGRQAMFKQGKYGYICGIKPLDTLIPFSKDAALLKINEYLDSNMERYPENAEGSVAGIVVQDYIVKYVDKLFDGSIPHDKKDRRIFRVIWEHKKAMLERLILIEEACSIDHKHSEAYKTVVREADNCRLLYATHCLKERKSVLPIVQKKLVDIKSLEQEILSSMLNITGGGSPK